MDIFPDEPRELSSRILFQAACIFFLSSWSNIDAQAHFSAPGCEFSAEIPSSARLGNYSSNDGNCLTHFASLSAHDNQTELTLECSTCSTYDKSIISEDFAFQAHQQMAREMGWDIIAQSFETQEKIHVSYLCVSSKRSSAVVFLQTFFGHESFLNVRVKSNTEHFSEAISRTKLVLETIKFAAPE